MYVRGVLLVLQQGGCGPTAQATGSQNSSQLSSLHACHPPQPAATLSDAQRTVDYLVRALAADRSALAKAEGALQEGQEKVGSSEAAVALQFCQPAC